MSMQKRGTLFFSKKSQLITRQMLMHLGMFAILAFVAVILFKYVQSIENDTEFQKIFLSRDIALLANTLYSLPGNVEYIYTFNKLDLSQFNFELKELSNVDDRPVVKIEADKLAKSYPYGMPFQSKDVYYVSSANSIKFSKNGDQLIVTKNE